jgi:hypothetical protein
MKVGDLVRIHPNAAIRVGRPEIAELGIVTEMASAWPNDDRETDMSVHVLYSDGRDETWYDWQLETVSEC